ncbi:MAG: DUF459 domain-containing protein [Alphaproteobacteria bacterium]|nr:DUF459 domain-containing protein [Alphaproteobacteria bacterium]
MRALRLSLTLIFVAALLCVTGGTSVFAQYDDSPAAYWNQERAREQARNALKQKPTHLIRRAAPRPGQAIEAPLTDPAGSPNVPDDQPVLQNQEQPSPAKPVRPYSVLVMGDNVAQWLAAGLQEALIDKPGVRFVRRTRDASGLVQTGFYDWDKTARELLSGAETIDLGVMMIGSNDKQNLREGNASLDPRAPQWSQIYSERIAAIARLFQDRNIPLIWVGMPVMKNDQLSAHLLNINQIFKQQAEKYGAIYVDVWEAFVDDRNLFAFYGPDVNGQIVRLRSNDGIHFTKAGARKLAHFVEKDLLRLYDSASPLADPSLIAAPPNATLPLEGESAAAKEDKSELAQVPLLPQKPEAGPVLLLTAPAISPGAVLANRRTSQEIEAAISSSHSQWQSLPHPGRADDFSWPAN